MGAVTSSAWSPQRGVVALAYVHRSVEPPAQVELVDAAGAVVGSADVVALPLR